MIGVNLIAALDTASVLWPAAATMALVGLRDRRAERRRRERLNERLHELRRPLQILALARPGKHAGQLDPLELATHALRDLDREINGSPPGSRDTAVDARRMVDDAACRWRGRAARSARPLRVRWLCASALVKGDPLQLAQALDNLISNSLDHGRGPITLIATMRAGSLQIAVRDAGAVASRCRAPDRDPRHGHGLKLAGRVAAGHGGSVELRRSRAGTVAALSLPIISGRSTAA